MEEKNPVERLHDAIDRGDYKEAHKLADEMAPKPTEKKPIPVPKPVEEKRVDERSLVESERRRRRDNLICNFIGISILILLFGSLGAMLIYCVYENDQNQAALLEKVKEVSEGPVVIDLDLFNKFDGREIIRFYDEQSVVHVRCSADMKNFNHHDCSEKESWSNPDGARDHFLRLDSETYIAIIYSLRHGNIDARAALKIRQERRDIKDRLNKERPEY